MGRQAKRLFQQTVIVGFLDGGPTPNKSMPAAMESRVVSYGNTVIYSKGSVRKYGTVKVKRVEIDLDQSIANMPPFARNQFVLWLDIAALRAGG